MPPARKTPTGIKWCKKCNRHLSTECFGKNVKAKDGLSFYCKECSNATAAKWREDNPEKSKAITDKFHDANPDYQSLYAKNWHGMNPGARAKYMATWLSKDYRRRLWLSSKNTARARGIEHSIKIEDIELPATCLYFGVPLNYGRSQGTITVRGDHTPSLDRIDSKKGYVLGNIQVISYLANSMKSTATPEQLVAFAKGALRIHAGIEIED